MDTVCPTTQSRRWVSDPVTYFSGSYMNKYQRSPTRFPKPCPNQWASITPTPTAPTAPDPVLRQRKVPSKQHNTLCFTNHKTVSPN